MNNDDKNTREDNATPNKNREAAANIIRGQLDSLFGGAPRTNESTASTESGTQQPSATAQTSTRPQSNRPKPDIGPYQRSYVETQPQANNKEWGKYKTAWQDYYKEYYEKYYSHHYNAAQKALKRQKAGIIASRQLYQQQNKPIQSLKAQSPGNKQPSQTDASKTTPSKTAQAVDKQAKTNYFDRLPKGLRGPKLISEEEASRRLQKKIQGRLLDNADKVRKSRHFMPIMAASLAVLIFLFLQFNQLVISNVVAYVSPGNIDPQNIVIDTPDNIDVDPAPRLIIPKINVDVPVHYDIGNDAASQNAAMRDGLGHFAIPGASSHPGEIGNTVLSGHSSGDLFMKSDYKFVFAQLHKLEPGDKIYAHYNGKRYTYAVTRTEVVYPEQVDKLVYDTEGKPVMTLITCTPLGTALQRLLVTAEQISPDPLKATETVGSSEQTSDIPGIEPTWIEKAITNMFGSRFSR